MNKILANENQPLSDDQKAEMVDKLKTKFTEIFEIMGFDRENDPNLMDSPNRIAKMYVYDLFKGNFDAPPNITVFPNTKKYDQIVALNNIEVKSTCSHHNLAFTGKCSIGYIPDTKVIGLSKLSRIVDFFARRPQIQEELTQQIADYIENILEPKGVIVVMHCEHNCMIVRGVQEHDAVMHTSAVRGYFLKNPSTKQEFFELIKG